MGRRSIWSLTQVMQFNGVGATSKLGSLAGRLFPRKPLGAPGKEAKSNMGQVAPVLGAAPAMAGTQSQHKPTHTHRQGQPSKRQSMGANLHSLPQSGLGIVPCFGWPRRPSHWWQYFPVYHFQKNVLYLWNREVGEDKRTIYSQWIFVLAADGRFCRLSDVSSSKLLPSEVTEAFSRAPALYYLSPNAREWVTFIFQYSWVKLKEKLITFCKAPSTHWQMRCLSTSQEVISIWQNKRLQGWPTQTAHTAIN